MKKKYAVPAIFAVMLIGWFIPTYLYKDRPEATVRAALMKLKDSRSVMAAVTVATFAPESIVRAAGADPDLVFLPVVFVGETTVNLPEDKAMSGTATFVLVGAGKEEDEVTFDVIVSDDGTSYVKFRNVPKEKTAVDVAEELNDKWYSMPSRGLAALLAKDGDATAADVDPSGKPSKDAWARIKDVAMSGELFGRPVPLGAQDIAGAAPVRRYQMPLKHEALVRLAADIKTIVRGRSLNEEELAEVAQAMTDRDVSLELWVDRRAKRIVQMKLDVKGRVEGVDAAKGKTSLLSVLARFTAWNETVEVKAPAESQPFLGLIEKLKKQMK